MFHNKDIRFVVNFQMFLTIWKTRISPKGVAKKLASKPIDPLLLTLIGTSLAII